MAIATTTQVLVVQEPPKDIVHHMKLTHYTLAVLKLTDMLTKPLGQLYVFFVPFGEEPPEVENANYFYVDPDPAKGPDEVLALLKEAIEPRLVAIRERIKVAWKKQMPPISDTGQLFGSRYRLVHGENSDPALREEVRCGITTMNIRNLASLLFRLNELPDEAGLRGFAEGILDVFREDKEISSSEYAMGKDWLFEESLNTDHSIAPEYGPFSFWNLWWAMEQDGGDAVWDLIRLDGLALIRQKYQHADLLIRVDRLKTKGTIKVFPLDGGKELLVVPGHAGTLVPTIRKMKITGLVLTVGNSPSGTGKRCVLQSAFPSNGRPGEDLSPYLEWLEKYFRDDNWFGNEREVQSNEASATVTETARCIQRTWRTEHRASSQPPTQSAKGASKVNHSRPTDQSIQATERNETVAAVLERAIAEGRLILAESQPEPSEMVQQEMPAETPLPAETEEVPLSEEAVGTEQSAADDEDESHSSESADGKKGEKKNKVKAKDRRKQKRKETLAKNPRQRPQSSDFHRKDRAVNYEE